MLRPEVNGIDGEARGQGFLRLQGTAGEVVRSLPLDVREGAVVWILTINGIERLGSKGEE
jgi:hypothetical protein